MHNIEQKLIALREQCAKVAANRVILSGGTGVIANHVFHAVNLVPILSEEKEQ